MLARFALALSVAMLSLPTLHAQTPASSPPPPVKFSGYIQGRETYQENVGIVGTINRARLTAAGTVVGDVAWRIQGEFRTGSVGTGRASVSLQDAYVRWTRNSRKSSSASLASGVNE